MRINEKEYKEMMDLIDEFKRILENSPGGGLALDIIIKQITMMITNIHNRLTNIENKL